MRRLWQLLRRRFHSRLGAASLPIAAVALNAYCVVAALHGAIRVENWELLGYAVACLGGMALAGLVAVARWVCWKPVVQKED